MGISTQLIFILVFFYSFNLSSSLENDYELILVHAIWRHGDRSPTGHLKTSDPISPEEWVTGGGGYGELTMQGMKEQFELGKLLRQKYIENEFSGFLHPYYDSREIYIRSTDKNRTINSATSNMIGMFSANYSTARAGIDYPDIEGWPKGFMPIPIHTDDDCAINSFCRCKRRDQLFDIAHSGKEFQSMLNDKRYINLVEKLTDIFGDKYDWENMFEVLDSLLIEKIHFPEKLSKFQLLNESMLEDMEFFDRITKKFTAGLYDPPIVNGIDVQAEIRKTRGGPMINEIVQRMRSKVNCARSPMKCDETSKLLKYYVYSTHDYALMSLLAALGIEDIVAGRENYGMWPDYSATLIFELFVKKSDKMPYFRALYHRNANETFEVVTNKLKSCSSKDFCEFKYLENLAKLSRPPMPMKQFCEVLVSSGASTRYFLIISLVFYYWL